MPEDGIRYAMFNILFETLGNIQENIHGVRYEKTKNSFFIPSIILYLTIAIVKSFPNKKNSFLFLRTFPLCQTNKYPPSRAIELAQKFSNISMTIFHVDFII